MWLWLWWHYTHAWCAGACGCQSVMPRLAARPVGRVRRLYAVWLALHGMRSLDDACVASFDLCLAVIGCIVSVWCVRAVPSVRAAMACEWVRRQYYRYNNVTPLAMLDWWEKLLFSTLSRWHVPCTRVPAGWSAAWLSTPDARRRLCFGVSSTDSVVLAGAAVSAYFLSSYAPDAIAAIQARAASVADSQ